ncbi:LamG-like jellyroll fold domain-containing protein [Desulfosporosinus sp. BICA1-9]|uniref:LamG-like jellyroll fold domain-containing protein n=1 Tax=Desulfosporosinus sp. BICA1-9 TaxID=1531958 RepID=UPI000B2D9683|nr:LamG-like jellyroll fold domain-containing protein [Desulfosporosinus sp. BICA1-9]
MYQGKGQSSNACAVQLEQKSYSSSFTDATRSDETLTIPVSAFTPTQGTIDAWVKTKGNPQTAIQVILDAAGTGNNGLILGIATNGKFYLQAGTGSGVIQAYSTTVVLKDTWYHVAGKWDSTGVSLYVNGVKQGFTPGTIAIQLNVTPTIGRQSTVAQSWFDSWIGDLRVSSTSRTDQEIQASYTGGQPIAQDNDTTYKLTMDGHFQPSSSNYGQNTLKVNVPTTAPLGDYGMLSKSMTVIPNSTYTLSGLLRGRTIQAGSGAFLQVQFYNAQDELIDQTNGQTLSGTFDWQKSFMTFETPKEAAKVKVALLLSGHGSAWFDALLLERGSTASRYNILENPSMEMGTNSVDAWTTATFGGSFYPAWSSATAKEGSKSLSLYSSSGFDGDWRQIITVKPNTTYTFTGWVKTQDLQQLDAQVFGTYYLVEYDANNNLMPMHRTLGNNLGTNDWKRVLYTFTTSPSTVTLRIGASLGNWGQAKGMAWFDGVRLFEGRITDTYLYDEARNFPTHHLDAQGNPSAVTYDLLGNKITETNALGDTTKQSRRESPYFVRSR